MFATHIGRLGFRQCETSGAECPYHLFVWDTVARLPVMAIFSGFSLRRITRVKEEILFRIIFYFFTLFLRNSILGQCPSYYANHVFFACNYVA